MTAERIDTLEESGFVWDASFLSNQPKDKTWNRKYGELIEYKEKHGHCNVPCHFKANKQLATWVHNQRQQYRLLKQGKKCPLTEERIDKLENIGFKWKVEN